MTDTQAATDTDARSSGLRPARATERTVFDAFDATDQDTTADGEWSPKDIQALGAWRAMNERLAAIRRPAGPEGGGETGATAVIHAERRLAVGPLARTRKRPRRPVAEVEAADDATWPSTGRSARRGPGHIRHHAGSVADRVGPVRRRGPVGQIESVVDEWPPRSAAFARTTCLRFHALAGRLRRARVALPAEGDLRDFAPEDSDLVTLRDELPELSRG